MHERALLLAATVVGAGCFPPVDPAWLEDREPELLALRIEIDEDGELAQQLAPVPADRLRVEALPGDRIRFRPWVLTRTGVLAEDELDIAYFACAFDGDCLGAFDDDRVMEPCDGTLVPDRPCAIGRGSAARYTIPTPDDTIDVSDLAFLHQVIAVAGEPGVRETDDCIDELRHPPYEDLRGCMLLDRRIPIGPEWLLIALFGLELPDEFEIPPEVVFQSPNFNPEVGHIAVMYGSGADGRRVDARSGDRLTARVGEHVWLTVVPDPRDRQQYAIAVVDGEVLRNHEGLSTDWYATVAVDTGTELWEAAPVLEWRAREPGEVRFDVLLEDGLGGMGWGSVTFEVVEGAGG